jgi:hypothetical protein
VALNLDSVNAKLGRADEHLAAIQADVRAWLEPRPHEVTCEVNPERTRWAWKVRVLRTPDTGKIGLAFGDCVFNLRCALDHLAYAIAAHEQQASGAPVDPGFGFMFLIANDAAEFQARAKGKWVTQARAPLLSPSVRAAIESVQPYRRKTTPDAALLALLRDFNNADKHHALHAVAAVAGRCEFHLSRRGSVPEGGVPEIHKTAVVDGAEIASFTFPRPAPNVDVDLKATIGVCLDYRPRGCAVRYWPADGTAVLLIQEIREVVRIVSAAV